MLNNLLSAIGYKQEWHVCWIAKIPGKYTSHGDGTYTVKPRMTAGAIKDLRAKLAEETAEAAKTEVLPRQINIIGLTRIGR